LLSKGTLSLKSLYQPKKIPYKDEHFPSRIGKTLVLVSDLHFKMSKHELELYVTTAGKDRAALSVWQEWCVFLMTHCEPVCITLKVILLQVYKEDEVTSAEFYSPVAVFISFILLF
jgi:hypothetical protein